MISNLDLNGLGKGATKINLKECRINNWEGFEAGDVEDLRIEGNDISNHLHQVRKQTDETNTNTQPRHVRCRTETFKNNVFT